MKGIVILTPQFSSCCVYVYSCVCVYTCVAMLRNPFLSSTYYLNPYHLVATIILSTLLESRSAKSFISSVFKFGKSEQMSVFINRNQERIPNQRLYSVHEVKFWICTVLWTISNALCENEL